ASGIGSTYRVTGGASRRTCGGEGSGGCGGGTGRGAGGVGSGTGGGGVGVGVGAGGAGVSARASSQLGTCSTVRSSGSFSGASGSALRAPVTSPRSPSGPACSAWRCAASVARKSSASGPSRMLARRRAIEHLLGEVAVHARGVPGRVVLQDRLSLHGRLCIAHSLADLRVQHEVAEVLAQDLDRFLRVQQALVVHRREDPLDRDLRVQILPDHRQRVL